MKPEIVNKSPETKGARFTLRMVALGITFLLLFGLLIDTFQGFYVLRHSKSVYAGGAGVLLLSVFYMLGEAGTNWISLKDKTTHPWWKRLLRLLMLLVYVCLVMVTAGMVFKYIGVLRT